MTWFAQHTLTPDEQAALDALERQATATRLEVTRSPQHWKVTLPDASDVSVMAERLVRAPDDTLLALNNDPDGRGYPSGARLVCQPGQWLVFNPGGKAQMMAKVVRSRTTSKHSQAEAAMRLWQAEQGSPRPGAMYGRVLQEHAEFAAGKNGVLYVYERGVYVAAEDYVDALLQDLADDRWSRHLRNETLAWLLGCSPGLVDGLGPDIINVRNGLLRWQGGKWRLRPHDPEVRSTVQLPVTFDREASCPLYDKLLETSAPDDATRDFLDEWSGYNLTSDYAHQKALMLGGQSGSGKSQYLHVLGELLGRGNMAAVMLQALGENRFAVADLYGKLANICADISSHELRMTGIFKQLTGGDVIRAEKKHKDAFDFTNAAKLSFSANEIPTTSDATSAFFDRWVIVRFPHKFRGTNAERKNLGRQITTNPDEMSGVLNRALRGLARLRQKGQFTIGPAMREAQAEFRREADSAALFVSSLATPGKPVKKRQGRELYESYRAWCDANGHRPLSSHRLYDRMRDMTPTDELSVVSTKSKGYDYFTIEARGSGG
jgi:P4 family phage/plasmid primase-like protien